MTKAIAPEHVYDLTTVSEPSLSADGSRLAFVRSKADKEQNETRSQIMVMSLPDRDPLAFTQGKSDSAPRFSPGGESIAFVRKDEKDRTQLWLIAASGGEARQITDVLGGVSQHAWSPDSSRLVFVFDVDPDRLPDDHDPKKDSRVRVARRIRYRFDSDGWRGDAFRHLFVVDVGTGDSCQLTDGEGDDTAPVWSPDGTRIAYVTDRRDDRDYTHFTDASVISADGGSPTRWSEGLYAVGAIAWAPESDKLAVIGSDDPEMWESRQWSLFVLHNDRDPRQLIDGSIAPVMTAGLAWTDGRGIVFVGDSRGESYLYTVNADDGKPETISGGGCMYTDVAVDGAQRHAVVVVATPHSSGDLLLIDMATSSERRLTSLNHEFFEAHPPATMEKFSLPRGGQDIESRVLLPPDFDPSGRYPLILDIHGGPQGRFSDAFDLDQQVIATAGYIVLAVNPRGSSSYGPDFAKAVLRDWGGEDYLDIMAAVDETCSRPYVDESRLGVHGYSYGGYMSAWIVGHDNRFGAAVVGAPCINLWSMYGTSDIGVSFGEVQWGGLPGDAFDVLVERSPLTYAPDVETPVLLMHGEDDLRCPIGQSEEYFVALKRLDKEVEFVRFPGSNHGFLRAGHPRMRQEYLNRMLAWFDKHLRAKAPITLEGQTASVGD